MTLIQMIKVLPYESDDELQIMVHILNSTANIKWKSLYHQNYRYGNVQQ